MTLCVPTGSSLLPHISVHLIKAVTSTWNPFLSLQLVVAKNIPAETANAVILYVVAFKKEGVKRSCAWFIFQWAKQSFIVFQPSKISNCTSSHLVAKPAGFFCGGTWDLVSAVLCYRTLGVKMSLIPAPWSPHSRGTLQGHSKLCSACLWNFMYCSNNFAFRL